MFSGSIHKGTRGGSNFVSCINYQGAFKVNAELDLTLAIGKDTAISRNML